jgi:hypothetical protein
MANKKLEEMVDEMYVVTTAQRDAKPNWNFIRGLETYAKHNKAEIIILPTNGSSTSPAAMAEEQLHHYFSDNFRVIDDDYSLNSNLDIRFFPVKAQQMDPTTSWDRFVAYDTSAIMASPKQRMRVVPNGNTHIPKVLMSTGACTQPNYKPNSWGTKAELDHQYGAIVVDVIDDVFFHYRQLRANQNGAFYDLGVRYNGHNKPKRQRPDALVMGDYHCRQIDPVVLEGHKELIKQVKPKHLILHDLFDGQSISHHIDGNYVQMARRTGQDILGDEVYEVGEHLHELRKLNKDMKIVVVKSNHDEVIDRWLQEGRFLQEPQNIMLGLELMKAKIQGYDPLQYAVESVYGKIPNITWLQRDDDFKVRGYQLANHGDQGPNGSRGSPRGLEAACSKAIVGHTHTPQIFRKLFIVGTSTPLRLDYTKGPGSWMNTSALLHANGEPQLINFIEGKYQK